MVREESSGRGRDLILVSRQSMIAVLQQAQFYTRVLCAPNEIQPVFSWNHIVGKAVEHERRCAPTLREIVRTESIALFDQPVTDLDIDPVVLHAKPVGPLPFIALFVSESIPASLEKP